MSYTWITPKTNWTKNDYITPTDYNRIRNNLLYLNDMLNTRYPAYAQPLDLGSEKAWGSNNYPSEWNAFEDALESFTRIGKDENLGTRGNFVDNGDFVTADQLNRIELCIQRWYELPVDTTIINLPMKFGINGLLVTTNDGEYHEDQFAQHLFFLCYDSVNNCMQTYRMFYWGTIVDDTAMPVTATFGGITKGWSNDTGEFFVVGGNGSKKTYMFDGNDHEWTKKKDVPTTSDSYPCSAFTLYDNDVSYIYTIGADGSEMSILRQYNPNTNTWKKISQKTPLQYANYTHVIPTPNGIYANSASYLYKATGTNWNWQKVCALPKNTYDTTLVYHNNNLYAIGGAYTKKEYYKLNGTSWTKVGDLPYNCYKAQAVSFKGMIRVFGGNPDTAGGNSGWTAFSLDG